MKDSLTIVLSGEAGQGLQTTEELLMDAINQSYYVFSTKDIMSRVRGGNNSVEIRVSDSYINAYKQHIDFLFLLNNHSLYRLKRRISDRTVVFYEEGFVTEEDIQETGASFVNLEVTKLAKASGSPLVAGTVLFGYIAGLLKLESELCQKAIHDRFKNKSEKTMTDNQKAFETGYEIGKSAEVSISLRKPVSKPDYKITDGTSAVGLGALAGGCNFIAAYPMSPGTGVLTYLAGKSIDFGVLVEQAEDEIAALNMVLGAWYAGARALTTTSGGGFALMEEAVSLSGITEIPCVVHIGQRPGPGTGLPTRTEQGDLNLVIYAGHGEFPRIVFAPGSLEDAVLMGQKAFYLADRYQVPVFILTDQFYLDSNGQMSRLQLTDEYLKDFITKT